MMEVRCALLTPVSTASYTHPGGTALKALDPLANLLSKTHFFGKEMDWVGACTW